MLLFSSYLKADMKDSGRHTADVGVGRGVGPDGRGRFGRSYATKDLLTPETDMRD